MTGGGLAADGTWRSSRHDFLVPVKPLSVIFRAKVRDELKKTDLFDLVDEHVWTKDWVVHCEPVGRGHEAFRYPAPYIFRVAISNHRILTLEDGQVTFQSKDSATDQIRTCTVSAREFIRRFLQHVLPDRFIKVRYYGLLSPGNRHWLNRAREQLGATPMVTTTGQHPDVKEHRDARQAPRCPTCGSLLRLVGTLAPRSRLPP